MNSMKSEIKKLLYINLKCHLFFLSLGAMTKGNFSFSFKLTPLRLN